MATKDPGNIDNSDSLRKYVADCVYQACVQVCGGGVVTNDDNSTSISTTDILSLLQDLSRSSVSFPNGKTKKKSKKETSNDASPDSTAIDGKPHDIEVRVPLTLYHRWKNQANRNHKSQKKKQKKRQREHAASSNEKNEHCDSNNSNVSTTNAIERSSQSCSDSAGMSSCESQSSPATAPPTQTLQHLSKSLSSNDYSDSTRLHVVSNLGLVRTVSSPYELAGLLIQPMEDLLCQNQGPSAALIQKPQSSSLYHVQTTKAGILCITSEERAKQLQNAGRFPCPYCIAWCKGMKGLWWHQQLNHDIQHNQATSTAISNTHAATSSLAIVVYQAGQDGKARDSICNVTTQQKQRLKGHNEWDSNAADLTTRTKIVECMFECVKMGDLTRLKNIIQRGGKEKGRVSMQEIVSTARDSNGSTLLLWSAGGGCLDVCRYLIETCNCDPWQAQLGKRSFRGRTALHWAARNGHYKIVQYLICHQETQDQKEQQSDNTAIQASIAGESTTTLGNGTSSQCSTASATTTTGARDEAADNIRNLRGFLEQATSDGTTAFGWASWQGHLDIMR